MPQTLDFEIYIRRTDRRLAELLPHEGQRPEELHAAMRYSALALGKRLRPTLCMVAAEAVGAEPESVVDAACATELVHCFSLIHDDLPALDDDDLRRGLPSCHKRFGEALAILAGDALFALAYQTLAESPHEATRVVRALRSLSRAVGSDGLVGGEVVDVLSEGRPAEAATVEFIHTRKTGALIASSCEIGALLGGGSEEQIQGLRAYGERVGLAFQIADDLLNELSTPEELGKAAGSDRMRQKATYPALWGLDASREAAARVTREAVAQLPAGVRAQDKLVALAHFAVERLK